MQRLGLIGYVLRLFTADVRVGSATLRSYSVQGLQSKGFVEFIPMPSIFQRGP